MRIVLRLVSAAFVLALFLSFSSRVLKAQEVPCLDTFCPELLFPFTTDQVILSLDLYGTCGPQCQAKITYKHRKACGDICDIYIDRVDFVDPTQCSCGGTLEGMRAAIAALLVSDIPELQGCYPHDPGCTYNFRVAIGGCYRVLYNDEYHVWSGYVSCGGDLCCIAEYLVCRDENRKLSFTETDSFSPVLQCQFFYPYPDPAFCYSFCEALPLKSPPVQSKAVPRVEDPSTPVPSYTLSGQEGTVYPNPSSGVAVIQCSAEEGNKAVLEINTMSGEQVRRHDLQRGFDGNFSSHVDLTELPSGSYSYRIIGDGKLLCSGVLTVTR